MMMATSGYSIFGISMERQRFQINKAGETR